MSFEEDKKDMIKCLDCYKFNEYTCSTEEHLLKWLSQFNNQDVILSEMVNIFRQTYLTEAREDNYLKNTIKQDDFLDSLGNLNELSILNIQRHGDSQKVYSDKVKEFFLIEKGIDIPINNYNAKTFLYVDDYLFTGATAKWDILERKELFSNKKIIFFFLGIHTSSYSHVENKLESNNISTQFWRLFLNENRRDYSGGSDVFWPTEKFKNDERILLYQNTFVKPYDIVWRKPPLTTGKLQLFTSEENREIIEEEFLFKSLDIFNTFHDPRFRPLGKSLFKSLGFGGTYISYRNCPNNTPLCLWWGEQTGDSYWYPLFHRITN